MTAASGFGDAVWAAVYSNGKYTGTLAAEGNYGALCRSHSAPTVGSPSAQPCRGTCDRPRHAAWGAGGGARP
eukprot:6177766-Pleurochrysis_carterae.AAC.2